jgi:hypothetical protein
VLVASAAAAPPKQARVLTMRGVGKVRLGMTLKEAAEALGARLRPVEGADDPAECTYAKRSDGREANLAYMMHKGRIVRIDVDQPEDGDRRAVRVRTIDDLGLGSGEAAIRKVYGKRAVVQPHPYGDKNDHYFIVKAAAPKRAIIFETWDGKVSEFRVGTYPAVEYIEGCS